MLRLWFLASQVRLPALAAVPFGLAVTLAEVGEAWWYWATDLVFGVAIVVIATMLARREDRRKDRSVTDYPAWSSIERMPWERDPS